MISFAKSEKLFRAIMMRLSALIFGLLAAMPPATAQPGAQFLAPPSLPPSLPGGANLPNLPPGAQREILARVLEAAIAQPAAPTAAALQAAPSAPRPAPNLSSIEAFFAERLEFSSPTNCCMFGCTSRMHNFEKDGGGFLLRRAIEIHRDYFAMGSNASWLELE